MDALTLFSLFLPPPPSRRCAPSRAEEAVVFGDKGLAVQLEDMVRDETEHAEETARILRDWPL